jgi:phosphoribosylformylglycinamidine synthase
VSPDKVQAFKKAIGAQPHEELGVVTSSSIEVDGQEWGQISDWKQEYNTAIEKLLGVNANN